jgi:hypothetical protein
MNKLKYHKALHSARTEFDRLVRERVELDDRIVHLEQTIFGLVGLSEGNGHSASRLLRLTAAIRRVLGNATGPLRPPAIGRELLQHGLNLSHYSNKLATIHNTLSRLERQREVTQFDGGWIITEKGRLALRMDALDFTSNGSHSNGSHPRKSRRPQARRRA